MLAELTAAYEGLKAGIGVIKGLQVTSTQVQIDEVKLRLHDVIFDATDALRRAEAAQLASERRIAELEQEIVRMKDWSAERQNYQLADVWQGAFAYMRNPGMRGTEPAHWLCANCFDHGRKSFLQNKGGVSDVLFSCDACQGGFRVANRVRPTYPDAGA